MRFGSLLFVCLLGTAFAVGCAPAEPDAGPVEPDGGPEGNPDAGTPEDDAGTPEDDAGTPEDDAGTPEDDGGPNPTDGGPNPTDGGPNPTDGGPNPTDGGPNPTDGGPNPTDGGPIVVDEAGDLTDPKPITIPATELHSINPDGDLDCYSFTTDSPQVITVETSDGAGGCPGDTRVFLFVGGETDYANDIAVADDIDGINNRCSLLETLQPAGDYVLCVEEFLSGDVINGITTAFSFGTLPDCNDGTIGDFEECEDGNAVSGDGCSDLCQQEGGYTCGAVGEACVQVCGNSTIDFGEANENCDDGNTTAGDGCDSACRREPGFLCETAGEACRATVCGDGIEEGDEDCDDNNAVGGDGCSADCLTIEDGYICPTEGEDCRQVVCGDGFEDGLEDCDDSNTVDGDGCSADCLTVEPDYICPEEGRPCRIPTCGDGFDDGFFFDEECDDGNTVDGDGCSADCATIEVGFVCPTEGEACREIVCGDGFDDGFDEDCDDGNTVDGDGCSADCTTIEDGYTCPVDGELCVLECGDGVLQFGEICDDGNATAADGCDACAVEVGFACPTAGETCIDAPAVAGGEDCSAPLVLTTPGVGETLAYTVDFTGAADDIQPQGCAGGSVDDGSRDLVFTITPAFTGTIDIDLSMTSPDGSLGDTVLYGYEAICPVAPVPADEQFCDDDGGQGAGSAETIDVVSGTEYFIVFDQYGADEGEGSGRIVLTGTAAP